MISLICYDWTNDVVFEQINSRIFTPHKSEAKLSLLLNSFGFPYRLVISGFEAIREVLSSNEFQVILRYITVQVFLEFNAVWIFPMFDVN